MHSSTSLAVLHSFFIFVSVQVILDINTELILDANGQEQFAYQRPAKMEKKFNREKMEKKLNCVATSNCRYTTVKTCKFWSHREDFLKS